jgi:hypothetical protein
VEEERLQLGGGGWKTREAAAYPGPDGRQMLRRAGGWWQAKAPGRRAIARH